MVVDNKPVIPIIQTEYQVLSLDASGRWNTWIVVELISGVAQPAACSEFAHILAKKYPKCIFAVIMVILLWFLFIVIIYLLLILFITSTYCF